MDRKTASIITDISKLNKDINNLKSEQPFGYDTTKLIKLENNNTYDIVKTLTSNARVAYSISSKKTGAISQQDKSYTRNSFQIWVNNMSTPYYGELSGLGVFTPQDTGSPFNAVNVTTKFQLINSSATSITFYIKIYAITTHQSLDISISETVLW